MDIRTRYQTLTKEIEIYRSHSLFDEAKRKCIELERLIRSEPQIKNKKKLLSAVSKKMRDLEDGVRQFEGEKVSVQMSTTELGLVKELFSSTRDDATESATFDNAVALLVFGQFEQALNEFYRLLESDDHRVAAAKNILRCHVGLSSLENAITQYHQWHFSDRFSPEELKKVHLFFQDTLQRTGMAEALPKPKESSITKEDEPIEEEFIDLLSIKIPMDESSKKGKGIKLDVSFQKGEMISLIISGDKQSLIDSLEVGKEIEDVRYYSPTIVFNDKCVVSAIKPITSGPKKGDYTVVMKTMI
jgi:hypothetical protein